MSTRQANTDRWARELYTRFHLCGACQGAVTLAEQLDGRCPIVQRRSLPAHSHPIGRASG